MITKKILKKYIKKEQLDFNFNFLIDKRDRIKLEQIASNNDISMSELLRILIKELIKEQKKEVFI